MKRQRLCVALIAFACSVVIGALVPASARVDLHSNVCLESVNTIDPKGVWIPVGCESVLCCQGCPVALLDWRIRVTGDPLDSAILQFENLSPDAMRVLKIKGKARWEGTSLRVWKGETIVSGFNSDSRSVPPIATPRLFVDKAALKRLQETASRGNDAVTAGYRNLGRMEVVVEQLKGKYIVNEARLIYAVRSCPRPPPTTDRIGIIEPINDQAVVLIDARGGTSGGGVCINDEDWRGSHIIFLGSLLTNGACSSEVSIFSKDHAMLFLSPVTTWTDLMPDHLAVRLAPMLKVPVAVWIVTDEAGTQERAEWEVATANLLFNSNRTGISFEATYETIFNEDGIEILDKHCRNAPLIKSSRFYKPNQLNVYYVDRPTAVWPGYTCWLEDANSTAHEPNIIFINRTSEVETLAHEIGHAFSLDHSDEPWIDGFGDNNIMWAGESGRTHFSLGQAFRMNVNKTSRLNVNGVRAGPVRDPFCADVTTSNICPRLALDVPAE